MVRVSWGGISQFNQGIHTKPCLVAQVICEGRQQGLGHLSLIL